MVPCRSVCTHFFMSQQVNVFTHLSWNQSKSSICTLYVIQPSFFEQVQKQVNMTWAQGYKNFMLNSAEHKIYPAHKC